MAQQFQFELVSPERQLMAKPVAAVILPGSNGQLTVLAGHAPMVATLAPGLIEVYEQESGTAEPIFVRAGLAEIRPDTLTVLAEDTVDPSTADAGELGREIETLKSKRAQADSDYDRDLADREIAWREALRAALPRA